MMSPPLGETEALEQVEQALAHGDAAAAMAALLPVLDGRRDDRACAAAARLLRQGTFAPDAMAAALDRLVQLVRAQEEQIRALREMAESQL